MVTTDRHSILTRAGWLALFAAVGVLVFSVRMYRKLPVLPDEVPPEGTVVNGWKESGSLKKIDWNIFSSSSSLGIKQKGGLADRFRLAGTFFTVASNGVESRMAVLDDLSTSNQSIVREEDKIDEDYLIVRILTDRLILKGPRGEENLWLSKGSGVAAQDGGDDGGDASVENDPNNPFGKRTGKRSWVLKRKLLMEYHDELMDNPERLLKVFDSMKPVYTKNRNITGYRLGVEGEAHLFKALGIGEGDIVRRVNDMDMTNRRRCEYLLGQFAQNRANAFVVDIERKGKRIRQTYEVR